MLIRFANLWEIPMGQLAVERGVSKATKDAGATMLADHTQLNVDVKKLADQFGVQLPDKPTSQQQQWIDEISSKTGEDFDITFAKRLRGAHGTVFGLVSEVRAGTKNSTIRAFAEAAVNIVMKHMRLLEATGHVHANGLFAEASARSPDNPENTLDRGDIVLAVVLGVVALAATLGFVRAFSSHGTAAR